MSWKRFRRIVFRWTLLALLLAAVIGSGLTIWRWLDRKNPVELPVSPEDSVTAQTKKSADVTNIALFGVDYADGNNQRSDCMMVLSVDAKNNALRLASLMRDSRVEVEGVGTTKLNHAYAYGGAELAIQTINQNFGLDIAHFVSVDFSQMAQIIDLLDGVTVCVRDYELEETNRFITEYCKTFGLENCPLEAEGEQVLNGAQAVSYARIRKNGTGDDWGRVERQGIVLEAIFSKVKTMSPLALLEVAPQMLNYVTTDLSIPDLASLAWDVFVGGSPEITHTRIPADGEWSYGGSSNSYIVYDVALAAERLERYFYEGLLPEEQVAQAE